MNICSWIFLYKVHLTFYLFVKIFTAIGNTFQNIYVKDQKIESRLGNNPEFWNMSKVVFRNYDKNAVRQLLIEVGKERYECAIMDAGLKQKPITLEGFYFEYEMDTDIINLNLYYRYPSRITFFIMPVLGYWAVPHKGWEMSRK